MRISIIFLCALLIAPSLFAQQRTEAGPLIHSAGAVFDVPGPDFETPRAIDYKVAFELAAAAPTPDQLNASLNSVARFMNMHARAGVPHDRIQPAVVVHGPAGWELLDHDAYRAKHGVNNPNFELVGELVAAGVPVILCGQTAASRGIPRDGLISGVQVALSAMTAFVALQEVGYRVNPW